MVCYGNISVNPINCISSSLGIGIVEVTLFTSFCWNFGYGLLGGLGLFVWWKAIEYIHEHHKANMMKLYLALFMRS